MTGDEASERPGAAVSGYRIERLIDTGGVAAVYEARKLGPGGPGARVACKVMHLVRRGEPLHRELVRREAVLGLRISGGHPNLVEVLDFFDDAQEQLCIVMELVDGASVIDLHERGQPMPCPVVRRIAGEVLEALVYLHGRGVLHRDLSPRNILVSTGGAVKVADLGLARRMEHGQVHTGTFRGTPMYATPEAIHLLDLDARADLFTLAAVLYELVTGVPPCGKQSQVAHMLMHIVMGKFAPLPPDTPADLAELITGLLRLDRDERRPQTAAEALALLRGHDLPVASRAELGELAASAQPRRDQVVASARPPDVLAPGHVLAPRVTSAAREPAAGDVAPVAGDAVPDAVPEHMTSGADAVVLERVAPGAGEAAPERVTGGMGDGMHERVADALAKALAEEAPGRMAGRVASMAAIVACIVVLAFLLGDRLRGKPDAAPQASDVAAPVTAPIPVAPVTETAEIPAVPVRARETPEPRRAQERADGVQRKRIRGPRRGPAGPAPMPSRVVPVASETPWWGVE